MANRSKPNMKLKKTGINNLLIASVLLIAFLIIFNYISREYTENIEKQRLTQLKQLVQIAMNSIEPVLLEYRSGHNTRKKTIVEIRNIVRRMIFQEKYGDNYIFMSSYNGLMLVQPFEPGKEMTSQWELQDAEGIYIIQELVAMARKEKDGGYVKYHYILPGRDTPEEKISYVKAIPELECYIGVGRYMGDLRRQQTLFRWKIFALAIILLLLLLVLIINFIMSISERRHAEEALRVSERRYRTLVENIPGVTYRCVYDENWTMKFFSTQMEKLSGYPVNDFLQNHVRSYTSIICSDDKQRVKDIVLLAINQKKIFTIEYRIVKADGELSWVFEKGQGVFGDEGQLLYIDGVIIDISERKQAEEALRESESHLRTVIETIPDLVWLKDPDGFYLSCNPKFERLFGVKQAEILGKTDYDLIDRKMADFFREKDKAAILADKPCVNEEEVVYADDGHKEILETIKTPMYDSQGRLIGVLGIARDITERKQAEKKLNKAQNYIVNIINSMPSLLIGVDTDGKVTQWNKTAEQKTGIAYSDAKGKSISDVFPQLGLEMETIIQSIRTRQINYERKKLRQSETGVYYEDVTIYPLIGNGVEGAVIRIEDVTEKVRMEEIIVQNEKMLSVGGLAAGMAHEINNPIAGMMQTASVMSNRLSNMTMSANIRAADEVGVSMDAIKAFMEKRDIMRMVDAINESGKRVAEIVDNMLSFARKSDFALSSNDMADLLDRILELAAIDYDLKKQYDFRAIEIKKEYENDLPLVLCEQVKIQQVMLNILRNGAQVMQESGTEKPMFILRTRFEKDRDMVCIEIEDNGPGMNETIRKRVFEPFFTTKAVGLGTGLGLSVSYFIITENHGGEMSVESEPGKGSRFIIGLPLKERGNNV